MLRKLNYGAAREGQKETTQNKSKGQVGRKSRAVNLGRQTRQRGSKLNNKQEKAKGKAQEV